MSATIYVGRHFEVRDHEQPTKYVFNGSTRVASITGSLSTNTRTQRLRLYPGWNLVSLAVTAEDFVGQLEHNESGAVESVYQWNGSENNYSIVNSGQAVSGGAVLWLKALTGTTVGITGTYADPSNAPVPAGGAYVPGAGLESWLPPFPADSFAWLYEAQSNRWHQEFAGNLPFLSASPTTIAPGEAIYLRVAAATDLEIPDPALRLHYYHEDHLGSSSSITDAKGSIVEETAFYPFGCERTEYEPRAIYEPYQFVQKERDRESGLHYFEARYLAGPFARFVTADPKYLNPDALSQEDRAAFLARPQLINAYSYVCANPLRFVDPTGLGPQDYLIPLYAKEHAEEPKPAPIGPYKTQDEAATAALIVANPKSISDNREYGGLVYYDTTFKRYYATAPSRGAEAGFNPSSVSVPSGTLKVGDYHTHGDYTWDIHTPEGVVPVHPVPKVMDTYDSDHFSGTDLSGIRHDAVGVPGYKGYLATPSANQGIFYMPTGNFQQFDPATGRVSSLRNVMPDVSPPVCTVKFENFLQLQCR
jgi:RHS repeat-associated protein